MNSIVSRIYMVVGLVVGTYAICHLLEITTGPPEVEMPNWSFRNLPYQLGGWQGTDTTIDPRIAVATGAEAIADRVYRNESGQTVLLHTAMFKDPAVGVYHTPTNCYRSNGWSKRDELREDVEVSEDSTLPVHLVAWEKDGERVLVAYWYQLGEHVLYDRFDLGGKIRWEMLGHSKWPALLKVMAQTTMPERDEERTAFLKFIRELAKWLNQPEHQKYLAQWPSS